MLPEEFLSGLINIRDTFDEVLLEVFEIVAVDMLSAEIYEIQMKDKLGTFYASKKYIDSRVEKGRQVAYVDLTLTGDMFRNIQVVEAYVDEGRALVSLGFTRDFDFYKYNENLKRYGAFLEPDEKAIGEAKIDVTDYLFKRIFEQLIN